MQHEASGGGLGPAVIPSESCVGYGDMMGIERRFWRLGGDARMKGSFVWIVNNGKTEGVYALSCPILVSEVIPSILQAMRSAGRAA